MTLEAIHRHDPTFDKTAFLSRAEAVLALVHRARSEGHPDQARAVVGEDIAMRLSAELDGQRATGRRQVHEGVRVHASDIVEVQSDDSWDTIAVRFSLEGVAYEAGRDGKPVAGGTDGKRRWSEVWWFQRQAGTTTSAAPDVPLDRCPGCGAPITPTSEGTCTYCHRKLASPRAWVLTRITDSPAAPSGSFGTVTMDALASSSGAKAIRRIFTVIVLITVVGTVVAVIVFASRTTKEVKNAFSPTTEVTGPGFTRTVPGQTATTGFVTPVANPRVKAPVNDVNAAAAAVLTKVGRPLMANSIHLYPDGRIIFELQAADDPKGIDDWVWKGGTVTGPEQGIIGADLARLYPVAGVDMSNLARLCDAAIGATDIADGVVDSPYLLKIGAGLRWYIPVQSSSRGSTRKTYQVAPDGTKGIVF